MYHNRPFAVNSGNAAFGKNRLDKYASDYIQQKRERILQCYEPVPVSCPAPPVIINAMPLYTNLYSTLDLSSNVCSVTEINGNPPVIVTGIPNQNVYVVDPSGVLFGSTVCGIGQFASLRTFT